MAILNALVESSKGLVGPRSLPSRGPISTKSCRCETRPYHGIYGAGARDDLLTRGGLNRAVQQSMSQSAPVRNGNRLLSTCQLSIFYAFNFAGYSIFLVMFAVLSCQGATLSNHRGIIYQVHHDNNREIIFIINYDPYLAFNVCDP